MNLTLKVNAGEWLSPPPNDSAELSEVVSMTMTGFRVVSASVSATPRHS